MVGRVWMGCAFSRKRSLLNRFVFSMTIIVSTLLAVVAAFSHLDIPTVRWTRAEMDAARFSYPSSLRLFLSWQSRMSCGNIQMYIWAVDEERKSIGKGVGNCKLRTEGVHVAITYSEGTMI